MSEVVNSTTAVDLDAIAPELEAARGALGRYKQALSEMALSDSCASFSTGSLNPEKANCERAFTALGVKVLEIVDGGTES